MSGKGVPELGGVLFFLTSGLFLGWSLGANDAANVFGTAVGSRMVRFATAASICSLFVVLGAVLGGAGATDGLGALGQVHTLAGAFTVALAAALTVSWMSRVGLPVSTTQAIVGGIVGWNLFAELPTDTAALTRIAGTWVAGPILGAAFSLVLYRWVAWGLRLWQPHLLVRDLCTRWALIVAGAFGAYSLGANNIANVMGVFVSSVPFRDVSVGDLVTISRAQQLFLLGGLAISVGVFTYSRRVMLTVGSSLMPLSPVAAWVVVVAHSLVLFIFSSSTLQSLLSGVGLPTIPLVPVSSSQAVIGAVLGVALAQGRGKALRQVRWGTLLQVASGWISTPVAAAVLCYVLLFVVQNVFQEPVCERVVPAAVGPGSWGSSRDVIDFGDGGRTRGLPGTLGPVSCPNERTGYDVQAFARGDIAHVVARRCVGDQARPVPARLAVAAPARWWLRQPLDPCVAAVRGERPTEGGRVHFFREGGTARGVVLCSRRHDSGDRHLRWAVPRLEQRHSLRHAGTDL